MTRDQKEKGIQVAAVLSFTQVKPGGPRDPDMFVVCEKTILTFVLHELGLTGFCGNFCACFICVRNKSIKSNKLIWRAKQSGQIHAGANLPTSRSTSANNVSQAPWTPIHAGLVPFVRWSQSAWCLVVGCSFLVRFPHRIFGIGPFHAIVCCIGNRIWSQGQHMSTKEFLMGKWTSFQVPDSKSSVYVIYREMQSYEVQPSSFICRPASRPDNTG